MSMKTITDEVWRSRLMPFGDIPAVPYVAAWSEENELYVTRCPYAKEPALFRRGGRNGRPILGKMDESRQRECMISRLCQVCRVPLANQEAFTIDDGAGIMLPNSPMRATLVNEPFSCRRCMKLALEVCPGLQRRRDADTLRILRIDAFILVAAYVGPDGSGDKLDQFFKTYVGKPPVGYVKAAIKRSKNVAAGWFSQGDAK